MFGGFAEALVYNASVNSELTSFSLDLKSLQGTLFAASDRNALNDPREDFILVAECNEQHGPTPLVVIPTTTAVHSDEISALAISLLSVDYQHVASGSFPREDTQLLLPEFRDNVHVFVNYTVLLDAKARGFVRPLCVAYVSHNKHRLVRAHAQIRSVIVDACNVIKQQNLSFFIFGLKSGFVNSQLEGPALVKYELTVANAIRDAQNARLVSMEKEVAFQKALNVLSSCVNVEPVGPSNVMRIPSPLPPPPIDGNVAGRESPQVAAVADKGGAGGGSRLIPLAHIAPLGFALAVQWLVELLGRVSRFVPSDQDKLPAVIYGACPAKKNCRVFEIYDGMFDALSDLGLKVTKKTDLEYTSEEVYCSKHLNTLCTLPSFAVPPAVLFDAYETLKRLDTSSLHNIFFVLCVGKPLLLHSGGERAVNFARFLALFVPRRVEDKVFLYVDDVSPKNDCAIAVFSNALNETLKNQLRSRFSMLDVVSLEFVGTKYYGHLLSSLWRRVQMVRERPQLLVPLISSFLCELELHYLSTGPLSTCDASILKNYDRLFQ